MSAKWWHVYGAPGDDGSYYVTMTAGESTMPPGDVPRSHTMTDPMGMDASRVQPRLTLAYLGSFDHEPRDREVDALKPEKYRNDDDEDDDDEDDDDLTFEDVSDECDACGELWDDCECCDDCGFAAEDCICGETYSADDLEEVG